MQNIATTNNLILTGNSKDWLRKQKTQVGIHRLYHLFSHYFFCTSLHGSRVKVVPYKSTSFKDKKSQYRLNSCTVIMIANNSNKVSGVTKRSVGTANVNILLSMLHKSLARPILE